MWELIRFSLILFLVAFVLSYCAYVGTAILFTDEHYMGLGIIVAPVVFIASVAAGCFVAWICRRNRITADCRRDGAINLGMEIRLVEIRSEREDISRFRAGMKIYLKKPQALLFQDACREALLDVNQLLLGPDYAVSDEQFGIIVDALFQQFYSSLNAGYEPSAQGMLAEDFALVLLNNRQRDDTKDDSAKLSLTNPQASLFRDACREASLNADELLVGCEYAVSDEQLLLILDALAGQHGVLADELRTLLLDASYEDALR